MAYKDIRKTRYKSHKHSCKYKLDAAGNPVEMRLTFDQWWDIWQASGKWEEYGCRKGQYCMCRYNDLGHYELGNVFIDLTTNNTRSAHKGKKLPPRTAEHRAKMSAAQKGKKLPPWSEERRANMLGRKQSPESIAKRTATRAANRAAKLAAQKEPQ